MVSVTIVDEPEIDMGENPFASLTFKDQEQQRSDGFDNDIQLKGALEEFGFEENKIFDTPAGD